MALTPEFVEGTFIKSIWMFVVMYVVVFAFNIYILYLNWKQSKVKDQMGDLLIEVREIKKQLQSLNKPKKKK